MIEKINFFELKSEEYWSFPSGYKGNPKEEIKEYILSGDYLGSIKKDGYYARFIKDIDGTMALQSRKVGVNGQFPNKISFVPQLKSFFNRIPNGTVLLGELYFPNNAGSKVVTTIMGCKEAKAIQRQEENEYLHYYIFDIWAYKGINLLNTEFKNRIELLTEELTSNYHFSDYVEIAKYYKGEILWDQLAAALSKGEEGMVITLESSIAEPGKRTARKTLKVKKELADDLDVLLTGNYKLSTKEYNGKEIKTWKYWLDSRYSIKREGELYSEYAAGAAIEPISKGFFYDFAGSIEIGAYSKKEKKVIPLGYISGLTEELRRNIVINNKEYINRPCKVTAMEIDKSSGKLRHPKFLDFRDDLNIKDCNLEKIYGE